jgi:hypothetical protein
MNSTGYSASDCEIHSVITSEWPRLYLDTGVLLAIADGKEDAATVEHLIGTCDDHGVLLVVSSAHFQDLPPDQPTQARLAVALERFRWLAFVIASPEDFEVFVTGFDIGLALAPNIRELNIAAAASVQMHKNVQQKAFECFAAMQRIRAQNSEVSAIARELAAMTFVSLLDGEPPRDMTTIFEGHRRHCGVKVGDREREAILAELAPLVTFLELVQELPNLPDDWRTLALLRVKLSHEDYAPGARLSSQLHRGFVQNIRRRPLRSDVVDLIHVAYFPYVDVATCDRAAFPLVSRRLSGLKCPRSVKLFRNGQLLEVLRAVEGLPNAKRALLDRL